MSKPQVLISGASGFIGSHFIQRFEVKYDFKKINLRTERIDQISMRKVDVILHLAAVVHQMKGAPAQLYFAANYQLTQRLAEEAKRNGVAHFVFMSTSHVYGHYGDLDGNSAPLDEASPCSPADPYAGSKLAAEDYLRKMEDDHFKVSIIRAPMVYGPGCKGNILSLKNLVSFAPLLPFRYSQNKRSLIYIENLLQFIDLVIQKKESGIYLPQDKEPISIQTMIELVSKSLEKRVLLFKLPRLIFKILCYITPQIAQRLYGSFILDSTKTNQALGYSPPILMDQAFKITFQNIGQQP